MRHVIALLSASALLSCGPVEPPPENDACLRLKLQENGFGTAPPARVSLFFSVDTCAGEPVAGLTADQFRLYEDDVPVSAFESQQRIRPRGEKIRLFSVLLLDLSGSMLRSGEYPKVRAAADAFLDKMLATDPDAHSIALYTFDGRQEISQLVPFTSDRALLKAGLDSLEAQECSSSAQCAVYPDRKTCAGWRCVDDSTNLFGAVVSGIQIVEAALQTAPDIPHRQGAVVVFTDGTDQAARVSREAAEDAVHATSASVYTVGLGGEVDDGALRDLGKDGYYSADDADALSQAFGTVAERLTAIARRYYLLEYCSPKRSGKHTLRVEAAIDRGGRTLRGDFTTDFDATGFESGCTLEGP